MTAHVARWGMARIYRRPAGGAVGGNIFKVSVPRLAGIETQLVAGLAAEHVPGALDILGGERLAIMPLNAFPQWQGQLAPFLVPGPAGSQVRDDRCHTVL